MADHSYLDWCLECAQGRHNYYDFSYWARKTSPYRRCACCGDEPDDVLGVLS